MKPIVCALLQLVSTVIRSRLSLQLEIVALRHQLAVYKRTTKRQQISSGDRSIDLYYGPTAPKGKEKNWVQTIPGQGWWVYLRFYAPTKAYFDKSWAMPDFENIE